MSEQRWVDPDGTFHERCTAFFFLGQQELGHAVYEPGSLPGLRYRRSGTAYFCPDCGNVWARIVVISSIGEPLDFRVEQTECTAHGGGSFLEVGLESLLEVMPVKVLRYEFQQELKRYGSD